MEEIQTRSEENGLRYFETLRAALAHATEDYSVWKISFSLNGERVRLVRSRIRISVGGPEAWILQDSI